MFSKGVINENKRITMDKFWKKNLHTLQTCLSIRPSGLISLVSTQRLHWKRVSLTLKSTEERLGISSSERELTSRGFPGKEHEKRGSKESFPAGDCDVWSSEACLTHMRFRRYRVFSARPGRAGL